MKKSIRICALYVFIFFGISTNSLGGSIDKPYDVATWKNFCSCAVTYSFDDWCPNQCTVAVPLINKYGFKATFNIVANTKPSWTDLKSLAASGHEIASHTMTHTTLTGLSTEEYELRASQDTINNEIPGSRCLTIAYPYCNAGSIALTSKYYIAARSCQGTVESSTPANFYNISSIVCGANGLINSEQGFETNLAGAADTNGWSVFLIHGIDGDWGYSQISSSTMDSTFTFLTKNKDKYWVATFLNVVCYIKERNCVSVKETSVGNDSIALSVTDTLIDSIYNYPITIRRPLPEGWSAASAFQKGNALSSSIVSINDSNFVVFDVVPDSGLITIRREAPLSIISKTEPAVSANTGVRAAGSRLLVCIKNPCASPLVIRIYDLNGAALAAYSVDSRHIVNGQVSLPFRCSKGSMLVARILDGKTAWSQKFTAGIRP